jgi:hypothetical protein
MMPSTFKSFLPKLFLFSLIPLAITIAWQKGAAERFQTNLGFGILIFFILITALAHYILIKGAEQNAKNVVTYFMAISGFRLLLYLMIILIYAFIKREEALGFGLLFLTMYMLFSVFEIVSLQKTFNK